MPKIAENTAKNTATKGVKVEACSIGKNLCDKTVGNVMFKTLESR